MNLDRSRSRAFTLIEIMVVVAILGIVFTIGIPAIYHMVNRESMVAAITDVTDLCRNARARAIFQSTTVELHFHPQENRMEIIGGGLTRGAEESYTKTSAQLAGGVVIDGLFVNLADAKDADEAIVRFYPNGTSDEFTLILHNEKGEYRKISLEVVTGLTSVGDVH